MGLRMLSGTRLAALASAAATRICAQHTTGTCAVKPCPSCISSIDHGFPKGAWSGATVGVTAGSKLADVWDHRQQVGHGTTYQRFSQGPYLSHPRRLSGIRCEV